jgi:phage portal protein BeeE
VGSRTGAPKTPITPIAALAIADVWAAVRVLADAASSLPLHVFRRTASGRERVESGKLADLLERAMLRHRFRRGLLGEGLRSGLQR